MWDAETSRKNNRLGLALLALFLVLAAGTVIVAVIYQQVAGG